MASKGFLSLISFSFRTNTNQIKFPVPFQTEECEFNSFHVAKVCYFGAMSSNYIYMYSMDMYGPVSWVMEKL